MSLDDYIRREKRKSKFLSKFLQKFFTYAVLRELSGNPKAGLSMSKLAIKLNTSRQRVKYTIDKLRRLGYVKLAWRGGIGSIYVLTDEGKRLLYDLYQLHTRDVKKVSHGVRVRLDGFALRFPIVRRGVFRWDREWLLRNWVKRYSCFGNIGVEETLALIHI